MSYIWAKYDIGWPFCLSTLYAVDLENFVDFCILSIHVLSVQNDMGLRWWGTCLVDSVCTFFCDFEAPERPSIIF